MKLTTQRLKKLIREELEKTMKEGINTKVIDTAKEIERWNQENGNRPWQMAVERWLKLYEESEIQEMAVEAKKSVENFKSALMDSKPDDDDDFGGFGGFGSAGFDF